MICRAKSRLCDFKDALILIIKKLLPSICPGREGEAAGGHEALVGKSCSEPAQCSQKVMGPHPVVRVSLGFLLWEEKRDSKKGEQVIMGFSEGLRRSWKTWTEIKVRFPPVRTISFDRNVKFAAKPRFCSLVWPGRSSQLEGNAFVPIKQSLGTPKYSPAPRGPTPRKDRDTGTGPPKQGPFKTASQGHNKAHFAIPEWFKKPQKLSGVSSPGALLELLLGWVSGCWDGDSKQQNKAVPMVREEFTQLELHFLRMEIPQLSLGLLFSRPWVLSCPSNPALPTFLLFPDGKAPGMDVKPHRAAQHHPRALNCASTPLLFDRTAGFPL